MSISRKDCEITFSLKFDKHYLTRVTITTGKN